jgi:adenosylcobinamide-GDP ribazoletransferase
VSEVSAKLAMVIMAWVGRSAHKGTSTHFVNAVHSQYRSLRPAVALFIAFGIAIYLLRIVGFIAVIAGLAVALVLIGISNRHFKGVTGDVFGAGNELARLASLIAILVMVRCV